MLARRSEGEEVSIVYVDLDGFKEINDSLGHSAGDHVLITVADRLATLTRHRDQVARLGGDEFALVLVGDDPGPLAERLLHTIGRSIELPTGTIQVGGSVGVAFAEPGTSVEELLRNADVAMYDAKARGRNRTSVFQPEMHQALIERLEMRIALDEAIAGEQFRLVYQPCFALADNELQGFEALIRWERADGTIVAPDQFIPLAERTGQIVEIGRWVLHEALTQLACWQREHDCDALTMSVNVSARQLAEADFVDIVAAAVRDCGVAAPNVTLELTETTLVDDIELAGIRLAELHRLGVRLAVDDYGAGNASLGYLRVFPIDILKIDRSFVWALDTRPHEAAAYLRSITDLAKALAIDTVAEGIEHSEQLERVQALGCSIGQGFHLARPMAPSAAGELIGERARA